MKRYTLLLLLFLTSCMSVQHYFSSVIPEGRVAFEQHLGCAHIDAACGRVDVVLSNNPLAVVVIPERYPAVNPQWLIIRDGNGLTVSWRISELVADPADTAFWLAQDLRVTYLPSQLNGTPLWDCLVNGIDITLVPSGARVPATCTAVP